MRERGARWLREASCVARVSEKQREAPCAAEGEGVEDES
jgi:hypothetical protein